MRRGRRGRALVLGAAVVVALSGAATSAWGQPGEGQGADVVVAAHDETRAGVEHGQHVAATARGEEPPTPPTTIASAPATIASPATTVAPITTPATAVATTLPPPVTVTPSTADVLGVVVERPAPPVAVDEAAARARVAPVTPTEVDKDPVVLPTPTTAPARSVAPTPPPQRAERAPIAPPDDERSLVSRGLPVHVDLSPAFVAGNAGVAMLVLLALLASVQLFNDTIRANDEELARWVRAVSGRYDRLVGRRGGAAPRVPALAVFAVVASAMALLVDPNASFGAATAAQVVGMVAALSITVLVYDGVAVALVRRSTGTSFRYRMYPLGLLVAIGCLALSRLLGVAPGVVYGLVAGFAFATPVDREGEGRAYARSSAVMFAVAVGAFIVHRELALSGERSGFVAIAVDTAVAALCVGGLQTTIVQLLPMRFINGEKIAAWSRPAWFALLLVGMTLYVQLVVRPTPADQDWGSVWFTAALVVAAVTFWARFQIRRWLDERRPAPLPAQPR